MPNILGWIILLIVVGLFCFGLYEIYLIQRNDKANKINDKNWETGDDCENCPWDEPTNNEEVFVNNEDYK